MPLFQRSWRLRLAALVFGSGCLFGSSALYAQETEAGAETREATQRASEEAERAVRRAGRLENRLEEDVEELRDDIDRTDREDDLRNNDLRNDDLDDGWRPRRAVRGAPRDIAQEVLDPREESRGRSQRQEAYDRAQPQSERSREQYRDDRGSRYDRERDERQQYDRPQSRRSYSDDRYAEDRDRSRGEARYNDRDYEDRGYDARDRRDTGREDRYAEGDDPYYRDRYDDVDEPRRGRGLLRDRLRNRLQEARENPDDFARRVGTMVDRAGQIGAAFGDFGTEVADEAETVYDEGERPRARLGVTLDAESPSVVRVTRVGPGSAAEEAGIQAGDEILLVDGRRVSSRDLLIQYLQEARPGEPLEIVVRRNDRTHRVMANLDASAR